MLIYIKWKLQIFQVSTKSHSVCGGEHAWIRNIYLFLAFKTVLYFFILYDAHCAFKGKRDAFKENRRISCEKHSKECEVNQTRMTS